MALSKSPVPAHSLASDDSSDSRSSSPPHFSDDAQINMPQSFAVPRTSTSDAPLLPPQPSMRSVNAGFVSSPLNPNVTGSTAHSLRSRPPSALSAFNRLASEDAAALTAAAHAGTTRGSMVLYRLAAEDDMGALVPPRSTYYGRDSMVSTSDQSVFSLSSDSKYPSGMHAHNGGLVPYAYDPDTEYGPEDDDYLHEPDGKQTESSNLCSGRGWLNLGALALLVLALLALFICYPVFSYVKLNDRNRLLSGNANVNGSGQSNPFITPTGTFFTPQMVDLQTPDSAKTRTGFDGQEYNLVFSDEFNQDGRTFWPGDDPYWEAVDLWYGSTHDLEYYYPQQIVTEGGALTITFQDSTNWPGLNYVSGMLQSWNKFCFTGGYFEVAVTLPGGPNSAGFWPGAWTMGNLGRPGYGATTDGTWPYSYSTCDVGTYPNQTNPGGLTPAAAVHSDASKASYNFELSWLPGQRMSACTCPGEDHPGPSTNVGRGAPEIDVFEIERNKETSVGGVASQSAQFAPFTADYNYLADTADEYSIQNPLVTQPNSYKGSAIQQAVSALTQVPDTTYEQTPGATYTTFGFEYWSNPSNPTDGFITWQVNGAQTQRVTAAAVGPDPNGSQVGQRLIPMEPMSLILNVGMAPNWQQPDTSTFTLPAKMKVDYVRVYQRKGSENYGCDPAGFPTANYINNHLEAYTNPNYTYWRAVDSGAGYPWPKNGQYSGGC